MVFQARDAVIAHATVCLLLVGVPCCLVGCATGGGSFLGGSEPSSSSAASDGISFNDRYEYVGAPHVGEWGGKCRCPSGETYDVGDNYDSCGSLACIDGEIVEACGEGVISSTKAGWRVTCDTGSNGGVPSPSPLPDNNACCGKCNGAYPFCSPVSSNCYHAKNKDYYQSCAMAPTPAPCTGPQCKDIKVMSYNTEYRNYNSMMGGYANKIKEVAPAIVGLQECQNRDGLAGLTGYAPLYGTGGQNYILYDSSKVTLVSDGWMSIPRDDYAPRAITWGQFKLGDATVWFFNTHLPHNHNEAWSKTTHAEIARKFLDKRRELGAENSPTIVLGDMNSHASDFNKVSGGGFESNLQANGFTLAHTARGNPGYGAIDHILYSTAHWDHRNCGDTGTGGSDHTSITCDLVLK